MRQRVTLILGVRSRYDNVGVVIVREKTEGSYARSEHEAGTGAASSRVSSSPQHT